MKNALLNAAQAASNTAADTVSFPVDALGWLLRKAGVPVPKNALLGSDWMRQQGLTAPVQPGASAAAGETLGLLAPMAAMAKAPQIARGLLQAGENLGAPSTIVGPAARQRGMIPVVFKKGGTWSAIDFADDGLAVVTRPGYGFEHISDLRDTIFKKAQEKFGNKYDHFFRFTNNPKEIDLIRQRAIRPSYNHLDRFYEKGLSVAESPHYGLQGYKYGYPIKGEVIAYGSDGEPLLNVLSAEPLRKRMSSAIDVMMADKRLLPKTLKNHGLPEDYFVGGQRWLNNANTFEPFEATRADYENALRILERNGKGLLGP